MKSSELERPRRTSPHSSELPANGERIIITDFGKPLVMITSIEEGSASHPHCSSDASKFNEAHGFSRTARRSLWRMPRAVAV